MFGRLVFAGGLFAVAGVMGMMSDADKAKNYTPVDAKVIEIDRECGIETYTTDENGDKDKYVGSSRGSCISVNGWTKLKNTPHAQRTKVDGKATMRFSYSSPVDGSYQTGEFRFDGSDTEFYDWSFGDKVPILAHNEEAGKYRKP